MCRNKPLKYKQPNKYAATTLVLCVLFLVVTDNEAINAQQICQNSPLHALVEIKTDGKNTNGTGVILTSDGYIVTARHVIDGYLDVFVSFPDSPNSLRAEVVAADDYLDVALLKVELASAQRLRPAATVPPQQGELPADPALCVGGFGINERVDPETGVKTVKVDPLQFDRLGIRSKRYGYIFIEGEIKSGYSGGGAFSEDRLYGINLDRGKFGSRILPFRRIRHFLGRNGLALNPRGEVILQGDLDGVAQQVSNNRSNINRILSDVVWKGKFPFLTGNATDTKLTIYYEKFFPMQEVVGFFDGAVTPIFRSQRFVNWLEKYKTGLSFRVSDDIIDGKITYQHAVSSIKALINDYRKNHNLNINIRDLVELKIEGYVIKGPENEIGPIRVNIKAGVDNP